MVPDRYMDPYFAEFVPLAKETDPKSHVHPGFEFLYLLDGELDLQHGDQKCTLAPGDAVYFDSSTAHSYRCVSGKPAGALIVTMHQAMPMLQVPVRPSSAAVAGRSVDEGQK